MSEVVEGRQSVSAALAARQRRLEVLLLKQGTHEDTDDMRELLALAAEAGVPTKHVDRAQLDALTHGGSHGGVALLAGPKPRWSVARLLEELPRVSNPLLALVEGVEDARNLGFVLRTAEAMGCLALLIKKHVWDLDAVEVSRPSSGAYERLPLVHVERNDELPDVAKRVFLVGCLANAKHDAGAVDLTGPTMLAFGGEKRGLSGATRDLCNRFVRIPTTGGASSLSLSHAAAILLYEAHRQRV